ncbi:hypothetical protein CN273_00065 [Bacillus thuringiensis]|nr:hypothetical protein CN273_00065 [Bacillus thuringiensis]
MTQNYNLNENYPLYPFRTYSLYTSYYPSNFYYYHDELIYWGSSENYLNKHNETTLININNSEIKRQWPLPSLCTGYTGYKTNKFDLKKNKESGGWTAGWAQDIAEKDVAQGVVAAGVSVASSNPAPFYAWIQNLVNRTISSLKKDVQRKFTPEIRKQINQLTAEVIKKAIQGKNPREVLKKYDTFDFKAGAIKYSGKNMLCGKTISSTWGMKPYLAFRIR